MTFYVKHYRNNVYVIFTFIQASLEILVECI